MLNSREARKWNSFDNLTISGETAHHNDDDDKYNSGGSGGDGGGRRQW